MADGRWAFSYAVGEDDDEPIHMRNRDFVNIPAHRKHRGEWTTPDEPTVWLAVFYGGE